MKRIIFYQKTAKELLTCQSHFTFRFCCVPFFDCDASNLVENMGLKIAYECTAKRPQNILRNTVYPSTLQAFILYDKNLFYQKTAKELLICQSQFIFRFCPPFFDHNAPNLVKNTELKNSVSFQSTSVRDLRIR